LNVRVKSTVTDGDVRSGINNETKGNGTEYTPQYTYSPTQSVLYTSEEFRREHDVKEFNITITDRCMMTGVPESDDGGGFELTGSQKYVVPLALAKTSVP